MDLDCMILLHYHQTGEWLPDTWAKEKERVPSDQDDHIWGADDHGIDNLELLDCADHLGALVVVG